MNNVMDRRELEQILKEHPDARIVVVSSLAYDDTFERARAIGAKRFVDKPFHQEQLLKVFEQALGQSCKRTSKRSKSILHSFGGLHKLCDDPLIY